MIRVMYRLCHLTATGADKELASTWPPPQHIRWDKPNLHYEIQIPGATPVFQITFPQIPRAGHDVEPSRRNQHCHWRWYGNDECVRADNPLDIIASCIVVRDVHPTDWCSLGYCWRSLPIKPAASFHTFLQVFHSSLTSDNLQPKCHQIVRKY
jgi:hypothetical protein